MLYQKNDIPEKELEIFRNNLSLFDLVWNPTLESVSIITELFSTQIPQVDYKHYTSIEPIYITKSILGILGFVYLKEVTSGLDNVVYYKYTDKTIYNQYIGITITDDLHINIGMYIQMKDVDTNGVYFIPLRTIKYVSDIQHILQNLFGFELEPDSIKTIRYHIKQQMKDDRKMIEKHFQNLT